MRYSVYINNNSDKDLTFTVRGISGRDKDFVLPAYRDTLEYFGDNAMTFNVDTRNTLFCITFEAPSNFEGWVSCAG